MTQQQIQQLVDDHKEVTDGMDESTDEIAQVLGRNNSVVQKMITITDIFKSFTKQELIDLAKMEEHESEGTPIQEES